MSGHYYRVGVHGPPKRGQRLMYRVIVDGTWIGPVQFTGGHKWGDHVEWYPVEAPPSELAPEPEDQGVEVDGRRYRLDVDGDLEVYYLSSVGWVLVEYRHGIDSNELAHMGRVAAALGLVDQPPVPRALVDWLWTQHRYGKFVYPEGLARRIEAGEFGPVEPSVEWVTDRLPNDDEYPVWCDPPPNSWYGSRLFTAPGSMANDRWRWVSLSVLLDAAGLEER